MIAFIFDTETTGLVKNSLIPLANQPRVIEFFGHSVDADTGEVLTEIEFLCNPNVRLDPTITRITGIKQEDLDGQPPFSHHAQKIAQTIGDADAVAAHNLSFDMALIEADCQRCGVQLNWPARKICTVEETEWMKGHRLSLGMLHEELFGEPFKDAHRARNDVEALTKCFLELHRRGEL